MDGLHAADLANQGNDGFSKIRDTFTIRRTSRNYLRSTLEFAIHLEIADWQVQNSSALIGNFSCRRCEGLVDAGCL